MQYYQRPDEPANPAMKPYEFVGMNMREKGYGKNCERRTLEGKEDAKWKECKGYEASPIPRGPPSSVNGVLGDVCGNIWHRSTVEQPM
jgi:hypothetical protein